MLPAAPAIFGNSTYRLPLVPLTTTPSHSTQACASRFDEFFQDSDLDFIGISETMEHGAAYLRFHQAGRSGDKTGG